MVLNYIWLAFFLIGFLVAIGKWLLMGDATLFPLEMEALFNQAKNGFEISLGLTGMMAFWLGMMKIAEKAGLMQALAKLLSPFFVRLFPEVPANHPVFGQMLMNLSANMLGLDNAATPLGLKAMEGLQSINQDKERASNAMIMFMVINTAGLTLIPSSVMALRQQAGALNPADVFLPCVLVTLGSALTGILLTGIIQKIKFADAVLLGGLLFILGIILLPVYLIAGLTAAQVSGYASKGGALVLLGIVSLFLLVGAIKKVPVYETFVEGAKEGFETAIRIIPYVVAMLVGIGIFRVSGALNILTDGIGSLVTAFGGNADFVPALPTGLMKPFSGSGARGLMVETMQTYGADSFAGKTAAVIQGGTETTFYTLAVYFGSVGIRKTRYAAGLGFLIDMVGLVLGVLMAYLFFGA